MGLPKRFSNKRPALKSLISRVLKGSERRGPRNRTPKRHDSRGAVAKNPAKSQTRLTTEQRVNLLADYEAGIPVRAIAAKYGVHRGTIPKFVLGLAVLYGLLASMKLAVSAQQLSMPTGSP